MCFWHLHVLQSPLPTSYNSILSIFPPKTLSISCSLARSLLCIYIPNFLALKEGLKTAEMSNSPAAPCTRSWSISEDSLRRYVFYASENCIQELLSASDANRVGNGNDGWKVVTLDNGVEISKRRSGSLHTFRSRWLLRSVSPQQFITVANAIDAAKQWDSDLMEARYIKDLEDNLSIIRLRFGENSKPLFRNREFIVYERRETMDDGTLVVAVASLPKEIAAGLHPRQNNAIRGLLLQSGWVVEKLDDDSCMVTYVVQVKEDNLNEQSLCQACVGSSRVATKVLCESTEYKTGHDH
ncbi:uncharacterized protein LOC114323778 isoform X2 [Camellia sinensis]|uniref:uncharacterized protein LOC114323778 isoform X2 n=1 Tax=Camellia sinensis TaxID=4442 RepID=UPI0010355BA1|nr:uncharacterized protein LOC114323778 isoform X2 [Camellia sinensis]